MASGGDGGTDGGQYTMYVEEVGSDEEAAEAGADAGPKVQCSRVGLSGAAPRARGGAALVLVGESLVTLGGATRAQQHFQSAHRLGTWEGATWELLVASGPSSAARSGVTAVAHEGRVWTFGGVDMTSGQSHGDVHMLDLTASPKPVWAVVETCGAEPPVRNSHSAVVIGGEMVVFGGANGEGPLGDALCLDLSSRAWRTAPVAGGEVPGPREMHAACATGGASPSMFVVGGRQGDGTICSDLWQLQAPVVDEDWSWRRLADHDEAICACALEALGDGRLLLFGGWDGGISISRTSSIYNSSDNTWCTELGVEPAPPSRFAHASALAADGRSVYIFGGINVEQDLDDLLLLVPPPPAGAPPEPA